MSRSSRLTASKGGEGVEVSRSSSNGRIMSGFVSVGDGRLLLSVFAEEAICDVFWRDVPADKTGRAMTAEGR